MGSGTVFPQRHRSGNEYILEWQPGWLTLATLGLYTRPWMHISYPDAPSSVGRFEGDAFEPEAWKPEYPNPAFDNMRPEDAFWAARIVAAFDEEAIGAIVEKARFSDPAATDYLTKTLIKRREKVLRLWLTQVNPVVDFTLDDQGQLTFGNGAVGARVASPPTEYRIRWSRFDNTTDTATPEGDEVVVTQPRAQAPAALVGAQGPEFLQVQVAATHREFPAWSKPVTAHFRREATGWRLVGLNRHGD
jgi:hypothetical protein